MRVGLDGRYAEENLAGIGKYIKYLAKGLADNGIECLIFYSQPPLTSFDEKRIRSVILRSSNKYLYEQVLLPKALKINSIDLYHATGNTGISLLSKIPSVVTIHDIIPLEMHDYFERSKLPFISRQLYVVRLKIACVRAKKIIVSSHFIKKSLIKKLHIEKNKIVVVPLGLSIEKNLVEHSFNVVNGGYIINHGGIERRKNLERLLYGFQRVHIKNPRLKLVITGENDYLRVRLEKLIRELHLQGHIVFTGYVDEKTLWTLIKNSICVCYPTLMEGFGLPILEGFAAGVPVITSKTSSLPEVAMGAALLIDPESISEIVLSIEKVLKGERLIQRMVAKGKKRAIKYNWQRTTEETLLVYRTA